MILCCSADSAHWEINDAAIMFVPFKMVREVVRVSGLPTTLLFSPMSLSLAPEWGSHFCFEWSM
jgi:hypothetical protein